MAARPLHTAQLYITVLIFLLAAWVIAGILRWIWIKSPVTWRKTLAAIAGYVVLSLFAVVFVGPFLWMLSTSVKVDTQIFSTDVKWLPTVPTVQIHEPDSNGLMKTSFVPVKELKDGGASQRVAVVEEMEAGKTRIRPVIDDKVGGTPDKIVESSQLSPINKLAPQWHNYPDALNSFPFVTYTINTLILCVLTMIGTVLSAALPAYGFSRIRWKWREPMFFILIATIMLPPQVTMLPVFLIFRQLGWTGTMLPLIVPAFFGSAFYIFLLRQFFMTIPQELSDAARIDGCTEMGILFKILAPISKPALATVALLSFTAAWMDFTGPLIYLHDENTYTLAVGLLAFLGRHGGEWSLLMAAATVMTLPMLVLFFFAQKTYIQGIALTGMK